MENNLIKAAQQTSPRKSQAFDREKTELALAWLKGEVSTGGVTKALGFANDGSSYGAISQVLRSAVLTGELTVAFKTKATVKAA